MPTHGASMNMCLVPDNVEGSDAARAARSAALVWSMGEGGVIWVWLGARLRVSGLSFCVPSALYVYVCAVCVSEVCGLPVSWGVCVCVGAGILGGVDVSRWLPSVPALVEGVGVGRWRPGAPALEHRPGRDVHREGVDVLGALCRRLVLASDPSAHVCVDGDPLGGVAAVDQDVSRVNLLGVLCCVLHLCLACPASALLASC